MKSVVTNNLYGIKSILDKMFSEDQSIRKSFSTKTGVDKDAVRKIMQELDRHNTEKLKNIIEQHGWKDTIQTGGKYIWTLIQHADHDLNFQRRGYKALRHYGDRVIQPWELASLRDRISFNAGKPQKYGTQLIKNKDIKKWQPAKLLNSDRVNTYRARVNLDSIEQYVDNFNQKHPLC